MPVLFFILLSLYRSTLDFGNEALQAAEKGLDRLLTAIDPIGKFVPASTSTVNIDDLEERFLQAMNDDLNTPIAISVLFDWVKVINQLYEGDGTISTDDLEQLRRTMHRLVFDVLGIRNEYTSKSDDLVAPLVEMLLETRQRAKEAKDWATSDRIRDELSRIGIVVKDRKDGYDWSLK